MYRGINFTCDLIRYIWYFQALYISPCLNQKVKVGKEDSLYGTIQAPGC